MVLKTAISFVFTALLLVGIAQAGGAIGVFGSDSIVSGKTGLTFKPTIDFAAESRYYGDSRTPGDRLSSFPPRRDSRLNVSQWTRNFNALGPITHRINVQLVSTTQNTPVFENRAAKRFSYLTLYKGSQVHPATVYKAKK